MGINSFLKKAYRFSVAALPDRWAIQLAYFRNFGRLANLKHPRTLNEKINWRKLNQRDPRFTIFSDKIAVKYEIAKLIGNEHLIPTLWVGEKPEDIPFDRLEPPYVIKVNRSSGNAIFVTQKVDIDRDAICTSLKKQLMGSHGTWEREWGYLNTSNKILIERMLTLPEGNVPEDYKFLVYHGRVHFLEVISNRFESINELFRDRDWNQLAMTWGDYPIVERLDPKPKHFEKMVEIAEKIGALFDFVRVDLYQVPSGVFFGETTFYPAAGYEKIEPFEWDLKLGEPWKINA